MKVSRNEDGNICLVMEILNDIGEVYSMVDDFVYDKESVGCYDRSYQIVSEELLKAYHELANSVADYPMAFNSNNIGRK